MNRKFLAAVLSLIAFVSSARADQAVASVQQKLKDQGFYYGEITGEKDGDTTAAIRRYQIRNGLQVSGELNLETQRSLGLASKPVSTPRPRTAQTPGPTPPGFLEETPPPMNGPAQGPTPTALPEAKEPTEPAASHLDRRGPLGGTPYETAPPRVQQEIIISAQTYLMRLGYYREGIDGIYGPGLKFALRNYQARFGLTPSGQFDVETLALLRLLPGQGPTEHRPFFHRRTFLPRARISPGGEVIYIPR